MITILPKWRVNTEYTNHPVFFLAGPVLGGGDWQHTMCKLLHEKLSHRRNFYVAIPCRYPNDHPLRQYEASRGVACVEDFERQLDWERHYLNLASVRGQIIFWLGCESKTRPRIDDNPYARDTYGELGEWRGRQMYEGNAYQRMLIGAEAGFPGLEVIHRNFNQALQCDFPIYKSMEEVVEQAVINALHYN